jgi:hypothetical protein
MTTVNACKAFEAQFVRKTSHSVKQLLETLKRLKAPAEFQAFTSMMMHSHYYVIMRYPFDKSLLETINWFTEVLISENVLSDGSYMKSWAEFSLHDGLPVSNSFNDVKSLLFHWCKLMRSLKHEICAQITYNVIVPNLALLRKSFFPLHEYLLQLNKNTLDVEVENIFATNQELISWFGLSRLSPVGIAKSYQSNVKEHVISSKKNKTYKGPFMRLV